MKKTKKKKEADLSLFSDEALEDSFALDDWDNDDDIDVLLKSKRKENNENKR